MTQHVCPACGYALPPQVASKGGGNPALPNDIRNAGLMAREQPVLLGEGLIGWRRMVWSVGLARKEAVCWLTGETIPVSGPAWRPITNGKDRMRRVSGPSWDHLYPSSSKP